VRAALTLMMQEAESVVALMPAKPMVPMGALVALVAAAAEEEEITR